MELLEEYNKLINLAVSRGLNKAKLNVYTELHHIKPRCMGGNDETSNLVLLTGREHYQAHKLLAQIYPDNHKLQFAWLVMSSTTGSNQRDYEISPDEYEESRVNFSKSISDKWKDDKFREKTILTMKQSASTPEAKIKRSIASKKTLSNKHVKIKLSNSMIDLWKTDEREKRIKNMRRVFSTPEYKQNLSFAMKKVKRKSPIWESPLKESLYSFWVENGKLRNHKFRQLAIKHGFPNVNYENLIKSYFDKGIIP